jgi:hypothetical protein
MIYTMTDQNKEGFMATCSTPLVFVKDATPTQRENLSALIEKEWGLLIQVSSLNHAFDNCLLPMHHFDTDDFDKIPSDVWDDIQLWLFMRFVGRKPALNKQGQFRPNEAIALAGGVVTNWPKDLTNPLDVGFLPY